MKLFPWQKPDVFFSNDERAAIITAVREAERMTSGEIRVFIENHCKYMDALDRAADLFHGLGMQKTEDRNGVLLYVALKDKQLAVFGDEGIHNRVGQQYWQNEINMLVQNFNRENYAEGIRQAILDIGEALREHFPFNNDTDKNELPDDIVFGK